MKKFFLLIIFSLTFISKGYAENVYDFLKKEYEYNRYGNFLNIYAHNSHSSKTIYVTKLEVMFQDCDYVSDNSWNSPDRVFNVNRTVYPRSDNHITVNARFPTSAKTRCYRLWAEFKKKSAPKKYVPLNTQPKKSGTQKFLDKILGN